MNFFMFEFNVRKYLLKEISIFEIYIWDCCFFIANNLRTDCQIQNIFSHIDFSTNSIRYIKRSINERYCLDWRLTAKAV